jgi:hypothetical protein
MYKHRMRVRARDSLFLLGSILLHLILLLALSISNWGIKENPRRDQFELNAIKVANLVPKAKNKRSTKRSTKSGKRARKKPKRRFRKRRKVTHRKETKLAKLTRPQSKSIPKQVKFKATKKVSMLEKIVRRQEYTIDRKPINKKQLKANFNEPKVRTFQEITTSVERVTKVRTLTKVKDAQIKTKIWQQNVTRKQVDKHLEPIKPTIQRQVVVKHQLEYQPRDKNQPLKLAQNRVTYKQETKRLNRRSIEKPTALKVVEPVEEVKTVKYITRFRRVTKKTTVVTRVRQVPVLKDNLALEQIPLKTNIEKEIQQVKLKPQREVSIKKVEYEERVDSTKPVKVSKARVVYEQNSAEVSKKAITAPEISTEIVPTEAAAVAAVSLTTAVKREFDAEPTEAYATSITPLPTAIPDEHQVRVEKTYPPRPCLSVS